MLAAAGVAAASVLRERPTPAPEPAAAGDTVAVYGPHTFTSPTGSATYGVERFSIQLSPTAQYVLRLDVGDASGGLRPDTLAVVLNGARVATTADIQGLATLTRVVQPAGSNTLEVTVGGPAGAQVTATLLAEPDATFNILGPRDYIRGYGTPETDVETLTLPAAAGPPYRLIIVNGRADGTNRVSSGTILVNGVAVLTSSDLNQNVAGLVRQIPLSATNRLDITLKGNPEGQVTLRVTALDTLPPRLAITSPVAGTVTRDTAVTVVGSVQDETPTRVSVNGVAATVSGTGFSATLPLAADGKLAIEVVATDAAGNRSSATTDVTRDRTPPQLTVSTPAADGYTRQLTVLVSGSVRDLTRVTVNANGTELPVADGGGFAGQIPLAYGPNVITVTATDAATNATSVVRQLTLDTIPPALTVNAPAEGATLSDEALAVSATIVDTSPVTVTVNGAPLAEGPTGTFTGQVTLTPGANALAFAATDAAGNSATVSRNVTLQTETLPPDPATQAPPIGGGVAANVASSTAFLYTGPNPIQTGVAPGAIRPVQAAVVRGRVLTREGQPLPGVTVSVYGHPELGQTLSRADGMYDLAVNGGGQITLDYGKSGYLGAQRPVRADWQDFGVVEDVSLVPLDPNVATITFGAATTTAQVARGGVMHDTSGTRRATLIFAPGTEAALRLPDGSAQPVNSLTIRATELTVGPNGPKAMPAPLPRASGYTYAVELTADEAVAANATGIQLTRPAALYVDNFLQFPVGTPVPVGSYDRDRGGWVPEHDGRVIAVVGVEAGLALLDLTGDGQPESADTLALVGIGAEERQQLGSLYPAGGTLWRASLSHFTAIDLNYPISCPEMTSDQCPDPTPPPPHPEKDNPGSVCRAGSIIECENQVLGESVAIVGVESTLNYRTSRVPGHLAAFTAQIPLTGDSISSRLQRIVRRVQIAGRVFEDTFPAARNLVSAFTWDGKDAYGRRVGSPQVAEIWVGYLYPITYQFPHFIGSNVNLAFDSARSFGLSCGSLSGLVSCELLPGASGDHVIPGPRGDQGRWVKESVTLGSWDVASETLGRWTLGAHHVYDPDRRVLHLGTGEDRVAPVVGLTHAAGRLGEACMPYQGCDPNALVGDGGPAIYARLGSPGPVAVDPDGNIYLAASNRIRRIANNGIISTFAGNGTVGYAGDGGPALQAQFRTVQDIELGPDGSLYVLDRERVRRITPDGIIRTVAGDTIKGYAGDDGPALQARFFDPGGIAVGRDGTIYIADTYNERVRAVMPDGYIHTIAGTGVYACRPIVDDCGDGGPALQARFGYILDVAVAPDGSIYTGEYSRIRRIGPDGIVTRVLGGAYCNYPNCGDGGPAVAATVTQVERINFAADGSLLLVDAGGEIRRIDASGIVRNIAGYAAINVPHAPYGEGMPATAFWMGGPESVAGAPDGSVYFAYGSLLYRIAAPLPGFTNSDLGVPSASGTELYRFDRYGRHLSTIDMRTGATLLTFAYDSVGRLLSMTDASGNATSIERGGAGRPTALVGPYGQRTGLAVDDDGNLTRIVNPAGEAIDLTYVSGGLLATYTDPRRQVHRFDYDGAGRLIKDSNPAGGFTTLAREERLDASYTVTTTTAEGVTNSYSSTFPASGNILRTSQSAGEAATQTTEQTDGGVITRAPDGTVTTTWLAADPYFGLAAPFVGASKVTTPAGLTLNMAATRTKYGTGGPFGYAFQLDSMRVNGRLSRTLTDLVNRVVTTTSPEGRQIISMIDAGGRPLVDSIPELLGMHYTYDTQGRLSTVGSGSLLTQVTYDGQGRPTTVIDPAGGKESYAYDGADRLIRRVLADSTAIEFAYDSAGNLTLVRPAGRPATNLKYSPVDLLWEFAQPPAAAGEPPLRFTYNGDRTLASMTRASGVTLRFGHDATGEISSVTYAGDQRTYVHEPTTGMLISLNNSAEQLAFAYDGSLLTRTTWSGAATGALTVAYDSLFRPASFTVNSLEPVVFAYDRDGLLTSAGALTVTRDVRNGAIVGSTLGDVTTAMAYDTLGLPRTYSASYSGALIFSRNYTRDRLGRVAALTETAQNDTTVLGYEYDALGRLQTVSRNGAAIASYEYDAAGNRIRLTTPQGQIAGTYDTQDRLLSYGDVTYGYDADGNRTLRVVGSDTTSYTYDGMALLTGVVLPRGHRVRYTYDGRGRRIAQSIDGVVARKWLYFDQVHPAAELNPADSIVARFVYDGDADVPAYMLKDGRTYRLITDQVGSVRLVMDVATGEVKQRLDYDEYGGVTRNTNPGFQPFGFAGGMQDEETGMVHFGARDYDPSVGRWLVKDPALLGGGGPNLYVYVENDPQNRADPSGGQTEIYDAAAAQFEAIYLIADYYRRDGHRRWPGERNSDLRHFCTSYKLTQILGPELTELFGLLNEAEGFLWQDLRHLRSRIRNHTPWAFQLADIRANERGIQEALRRRHANTCPADPSECQ